MANQRRKRRKRRKRLSPDERRARRIRRAHKKEIRSIFTTVGFERISSASDKEFTFQGTTSDFDDIFILENIVALIEYTSAQESDISTHLKRKKILYDKILDNTRDFIEFASRQSSEFRSHRTEDYSPSQMKVVIVYCSVNSIKKSLKQEVPRVKYLDFQISKYFNAVTNAIRQSARYEFLNFLGLAQNEIGENALSPSIAAHTSYSGSVLPEEHSHFRKGYKVVSFYVDPEALLSRCYVLRKDGWLDGNLYQRMIQKSKIEAIRKHLLEERRVFINNIIVTLPNTTNLLDKNGRVLEFSTLTRTGPVNIQLPSEYNSVGLVDGQHRVFSYYEGGNNESIIKNLRKRQNLLATGIIYPPSTSTSERIKFEAGLFLEINANQTNAKSDVKQAIGLLLHPFSPESIAKQVVNRLNDDGPLSNQFERYFFEKGKLKTTSVVSYGIRHIVKPYGEDSLFKTWNHRKKRRLAARKNSEVLAEYVQYCVDEINQFLGAVRTVLPKEKWTADKKRKGLLTTTNINGFIVCLRKIVEKRGVHKFGYYKAKLASLHEFDFSEYRSSQYGRMGEELYKQFFAGSRS